jgi:hypothetical protein
VVIVLAVVTAVRGDYVYQESREPTGFQITLPNQEA